MEWAATPKQAAFLAAEEDEVLYGGAAGGGKSDALLIFSIIRRQAIPKSRGLILRRTFPELERSLILRSHELLTGKARYRTQQHRWEFPNGSLLEFGKTLERIKLQIQTYAGPRWAIGWYDPDRPGLAVVYYDEAYAVVHVPSGTCAVPRTWARRASAAKVLRELSARAEAEGFSWNAGVEELRQGAAVGVWVEARKKFR